MLYMFRTILVHHQEQLYKLCITFGICRYNTSDCCVAIATTHLVGLYTYWFWWFTHLTLGSTWLTWWPTLIPGYIPYSHHVSDHQSNNSLDEKILLHVMLKYISCNFITRAAQLPFNVTDYKWITCWNTIWY
jgi:hypothetical protein